jgi:hypothetical protein
MLLLATAMTAARPDLVHACAVCYGDPESPMAKGVVAGVLTMVGIIGVVLVGIAGTGVYWIQRSRRLRRCEDVQTPPEGC